MEFDRNIFADANDVGPVDEFPAVLDYEGARGWLWNSPESQFLLGVDSANNPVTVDVSCDTPHVLISAGSGAGKSTIARSLSTQALVKGASAVFLDVKRVSHRWAKNLPGVTYASDDREIASVLVSIAAELHRRYKVIDDYPGSIDDAPVGPRIVIIAEELNSLMDAMKAFEKELPRGTYGPVRALKDIVNLGRAAKVNVIAFAQYADAQTIPTSMRESFGYRILIRHNFNSWSMLVPHAVKMCPLAPQQPGRGYTVMGDRAVMTQFLYLTEEECAAMVRSAWEARERMGLIHEPTPKEQKALDAARLRELERLGA